MSSAKKNGLAVLELKPQQPSINAELLSTDGTRCGVSILKGTNKFSY
jgi:hypothetical protein